MSIQDHQPGLILFMVILILAIYIATRKVDSKSYFEDKLKEDDTNLKEKKEPEKLEIKLKSTPIYDEQAERKTRKPRTKPEKKTKPT